MADYTGYDARNLRQYKSVSKENLSTLLDELIERVIQQSEAIKELDERVIFLENNKS
jgi:hypothetical protein